MPLPKLTVPLFDTNIPSTKLPIRFRPFLVKEEKILLIAQSGESKKEMILALKQIINNCTLTHEGGNIDVEQLTLFDLEYLFVKIRAKSVDNVVTLRYVDHEDEKTYEFKVPLDNIEVIFDETHTNKIKITDSVGVIMKYPTASMMNDIDFDNIKEVELTSFLVKKCMDKIWEGDNLFIVKESTSEELDEFIDSLDVDSYKQIQKFFETMPKLHYEIKYINSKGTDRKIELESLNDFFSFA